MTAFIYCTTQQETKDTFFSLFPASRTLATNGLFFSSNNKHSSVEKNKLKSSQFHGQKLSKLFSHHGM